MPTLPELHAGPPKAKRLDLAKKRNHNRALGTNHRRWRRLRKLVLAEEPICRVCIEENCIPARPSQEVDHIDGDAYNNARDNLQGICKPHHSKKTATEMKRGDDGRWT